jgi:thioesterase domain-containing protein
MLAPAWPDRRLEIMAGRYAQAVRAAEPAAPVVLGGYSFGASLAFEVARALEVHGCAPILLIIIDSPVRGWRRSHRESRADQYKERVRAASNADRLRIVAGSVQWRLSRAYYLATVGAVPRTLSRQFDVFRFHHDRMVRRYEPTGTYDGAMLVLRSDDRPAGDGDLGWNRLVNGPITVVPVAGHHERLLREPWVGAVAQAMNDAIARFASAADEGTRR